MVEARPAPGGGIEQCLDLDDVWVIGESGEVALWCNSVTLAIKLPEGESWERERR